MKKRQHLKSLYFCHNDALSCCCWVFVRRVGEGCSPKFCSMPCLCLCILLEFVTWMASWATGELLLFNEVHVQHIFLCKWGLTFSPSCIGVLVYSWVVNACEMFDCALTKVGMLRGCALWCVHGLFSSFRACSPCTFVG